MSESIPGRIGGVSLLAGICFGIAIAGAAGARPPELEPILPTCQGVYEVVLPWSDPGINVELPRERPLTRSVSYSEAAPIEVLPLGCNDLWDLAVIDPWFALPGDPKDSSERRSR